MNIHFTIKNGKVNDKKQCNLYCWHCSLNSWRNYHWQACDWAISKQTEKARGRHWSQFANFSQDISCLKSCTIYLTHVFSLIFLILFWKWLAPFENSSSHTHFPGLFHQIQGVFKDISWFCFFKEFSSPMAKFKQFSSPVRTLMVTVVPYYA